MREIEGNKKGVFDLNKDAIYYHFINLGYSQFYAETISKYPKH